MYKLGLSTFSKFHYNTSSLTFAHSLLPGCQDVCQPILGLAVVAVVAAMAVVVVTVVS